MKKIPQIDVGIVSAGKICFRLNAPYRLSGTKVIVSGEGKAIISENGEISVSFNDSPINAIAKENGLPDSNFVLLEPLEPETADFDLYDVVIGIQFHWERKENQRFKGKLKFIADSGSLVAINILPVEDYLVSVISSEMSAASSLEFLKTHAVISRSWLLAQKEKASGLSLSGKIYSAVTETADEYCRWYDREDHSLFDVCADDHCQRYQGITKAFTQISEEAVRSTGGEVLIFEDNICDARFSKCCGGITENFENNWEPVVHPYLTQVRDILSTNDSGSILDLTREEEAEKWIRSVPPAFCNTNNKKVLSQILNDYDQETTTFFRWKVVLTQEQISDLLCRKTGWDFGYVHDLVPVQRGNSGRLVRLKIIGTKKTMTIGKELFIRKALSESHLYSSAFIIEKTSEKGGIPTAFTLIGAGWGHGSGLCQIGAAMMGEKGYGYKEILAHYFKGATLEKRY
jgi:SpoIID/LytB domain